MAKGREHWHTPVGDRRTKDQLSETQRAFNRLQAGLRALMEQSIRQLSGPRIRGAVARMREPL